MLTFLNIVVSSANFSTLLVILSSNSYMLRIAEVLTLILVVPHSKLISSLKLLHLLQHAVFCHSAIILSRVKKIMIFLINKIEFLVCFEIWNIDIYTDVYSYNLFQTYSIQFDLGTCLNRGYMSVAYITTLGNVHMASPLVVA